MEETKIILADFYCVFVLKKYLSTTLKWSHVISGEKMMDSYESNCTSFTFDYFIKLW